MRRVTKNIVVILLLYLLIINIVACDFDGNYSKDNSISYQNSIDESVVESKTQINEDRVNQLLSQMTTKEKVGQLFLVRCYPDKAVEDIENLSLGGLVLFASDFEKTVEQVKADIKKYKNAAKYGLFIAVDEEGGTVVRVSKFKQYRNIPFLSPLDIYKDGGIKLLEQITKEKAELLLSLGINVNLAPVCDLPTKKTSFIYQRSAGTDAAIGSDIVEAIVKTSEEAGLGTTLKHFPGYGDNADTHIGFSFDNRSLDSFRERDFLPFKAGISAGANAVMISHITVNSIDKENPASLSEAVHRILREELNFDGVIITDDLSMDAVKDYIEISQVGVKAFLAGNDIICTSDYAVLYDSIYNAVEDGTITIKRLDESVLRILNWKLKLGIID